LVARQIFNFKLDPRKRDRNTKMSNFFLKMIRITSLTFFLNFLILWDRCNAIGYECIFLVKKRNFSFNDFTSLERLANKCLICINCHIPIIFYLFKTIIDHSASTCFWSYLHETNFFFSIFFSNQLSLELSFWGNINLLIFWVLRRKRRIFTLSAWWWNIFLLRWLLVGVAFGFPNWCGLRGHLNIFKIDF
jgi:hypothetical protein